MKSTSRGIPQLLEVTFGQCVNDNTVARICWIQRVTDTCSMTDLPKNRASLTP